MPVIRECAAANKIRIREWRGRSHKNDSDVTGDMAIAGRKAGVLSLLLGAITLPAGVVILMLGPETGCETSCAWLIQTAGDAPLVGGIAVAIGIAVLAVGVYLVLPRARVAQVKRPPEFTGDRNSRNP